MRPFPQEFRITIDDGFSKTEVVLRGDSAFTTQTLIDRMTLGTDLAVTFQDTTILAAAGQATGSQ